MPARSALPLVLLAATATALSPHAVRAQGSGTVNMYQSGPAGRCTLEPSAIAPTCLAVDGAAVLTSGDGTVRTVLRSESTVGGPLRAEATVTVTGSTADVIYGGAARTGYYDALTISPSDAAFARFFLSGDGFGSSSIGYDNPATRTYGIFFLANYGTVSVPEAYGTPAGAFPVRQFLLENNDGMVSGYVDVPVSVGTNNILIGFTALVNMGRPLDTTDAWSGTATADYMHTGYVTGLSILDANRTDISSQVEWSFASGTNFATVPEPGTWAMLGSGLLALAGFSLRRRRARA